METPPAGDDVAIHVLERGEKVYRHTEPLP